MWKQRRKLLSAGILYVLMCCYAPVTLAGDMLLDFHNVSDDKNISVDKVLCDGKDTGISISNLGPHSETIGYQDFFSDLFKGGSRIEISGTCDLVAGDPGFIGMEELFNCTVYMISGSTCTSLLVRITVTAPQYPAMTNWSIEFD